MEIRGERECRDCGTRFSYFETGEVTCPECGSLHSRGVGDRAEHTDAAAALDLTPVRVLFDEEPLETVAERAAEAAGEYTRAAGFVAAGELQALDDTYVAAVELRLAGAAVARRLRVDDAVERYFLSLLADADDGERPPPEAVPDALRSARGLAAARAVAAYQRDLRRVRDEFDSPVPSLLPALTTRRKRIEALDGDVPPREADALLGAMQDLSRYLVSDDETALARAQDRLDEAAD